MQVARSFSPETTPEKNLTTIPEKKRWLALGANILLVGLLFSLTNWLGLILSGGDYTPFSVGPNVSALTFDETQLYTPGPTRFMAQGSLPSEVDIWELRNLHNGYPVMHSILIGTMAKILGSLELAWMVMHAILPICAWLLLYWVFGQFTQVFLLRASASWITLILPFGPRNSFLLGSFALYQPLEFIRTPQPALSFTFLLAAIAAGFVALKSNKTRMSLAAGFTTGLLCYCYYFVWIPAFSGLLLAFAAAVFLGQKKLAKNLLVIGFSAGLTASAYFLRLWQASKDGAQVHLLRRVGGFDHFSSWGCIFLGIFLVVGFFLFQFLYRRELESRHNFPFHLLAYLLLLVLAGAGVGLNLQLVSGYNAQHGHYFNRILQPVATILLLAFVFRELERKPRKWAVHGLGVFAAILIILSTVRSVYATQHCKEDHRLSNPSMQLIQWLKDNKIQDKIIGTTDSSLTVLIPALTTNWGFVPLGDRTMATDDEILLRYMAMARLEGITLPQVSAILNRWDAVSRLWLIRRYLLLFTAKKIAVDYHWEKAEPAKVLKNRRLDYAVLSTGGASSEIVKVYPRAHTVYTNTVYKLVKLE